MIKKVFYVEKDRFIQYKYRKLINSKINLFNKTSNIILTEYEFTILLKEKRLILKKPKKNEFINLEVS